MTATAPTATICAGPGCSESLKGRPATARYCGSRCRRVAERERARASHPAADRWTTTTTRRRTVTRDPAQVVAVGGGVPGGTGARDRGQLAQAPGALADGGLHQPGKGPHHQEGRTMRRRSWRLWRRWRRRRRWVRRPVPGLRGHSGTAASGMWRRPGSDMATSLVACTSCPGWNLPTACLLV